MDGNQRVHDIGLVGLLEQLGRFEESKYSFLICLQDSDHSDAEANVTEQVNSTTDVSFTASEP